MTDKQLQELVENAIHLLTHHKYVEFSAIFERIESEEFDNCNRSSTDEIDTWIFKNDDVFALQAAINAYPGYIDSTCFGDNGMDILSFAMKLKSNKCLDFLIPLPWELGSWIMRHTLIELCLHEISRNNIEHVKILFELGTDIYKVDCKKQISVFDLVMHSDLIVRDTLINWVVYQFCFEFVLHRFLPTELNSIVEDYVFRKGYIPDIWTFYRDLDMDFVKFRLLPIICPTTCNWCERCVYGRGGQENVVGRTIKNVLKLSPTPNISPPSDMSQDYSQWWEWSMAHMDKIATTEQIVESKVRHTLLRELL